MQPCCCHQRRLQVGTRTDGGSLVLVECVVDEPHEKTETRRQGRAQMHTAVRQQLGSGALQTQLSPWRHARPKQQGAFVECTSTSTFQHRCRQ